MDCKVYKRSRFFIKLVLLLYAFSIVLFLGGCTGGGGSSSDLSGAVPIAIDMRVMRASTTDPTLVIPTIIPADTKGTVSVKIYSRPSNMLIYANTVDYQEGGILVKNVTANSTYSVELNVAIRDFPASGEFNFGGTAEVFVHDINADVFRDAPPDKRYAKALVYLVQIGVSVIQLTPVMLQFGDGLPDEIVSGQPLPDFTVRPVTLAGETVTSSTVIVTLSSGSDKNISGVLTQQTVNGSAIFKNIILTGEPGTEVFLSASSGFLFPAIKYIRIK